ncbi:hypothetical protein BDW22DRAFT_1361704 [Trametopsis cervina]|nr:hypothetical protein BDW22DRAFT_1361704 [Trametopsis cervina]
MAAYSRALLVVVQSVAYQLASTPPNATPPSARFDGAHPWYIRIAPTVMKIQQPLMWLCALAELSLIAYAPLSRWALSTATINASDVPVFATSTTVLGTVLVVLGAALRLSCFRALGSLFTFDLTILPEHTLVTRRAYAYVRHPAYSGSLSMIAGLALVNLTPGSWVAECGVLGRGRKGIAVRAIGGAAWWVWWLAVGIRRCEAEDAQLRKTFGKEWEVYAARVRYWFIPGVL